MAYQSKFFRDKQGDGGGDSNSSAPTASDGGNYRSRFFQSGAYRSAVGASGLQRAETHERQDVTDNWERLPSHSRAETVPAPSMRRTVREELASGRNPVMGQTVRDMGRAGIELAAPKVSAPRRAPEEVQYDLGTLEEQKAALDKRLRDLQRQGAGSFTTASRSAAEWRTEQIRGLQGQLAALEEEMKPYRAELEEARQAQRQALIDSGEYRDATLKDLTVGSFRQGYNNAIYGQESYKAMLGRKNQEEAYRAKLEGEEYKFLTDGWLENAASGAAGLLGQQVRQWTDPRSLGMAGTAGAMAGIAGQAGPQVLLPEEIITVPSAALVGLQAGSALSNYEIEAGLAYNEMVGNGITPETARNIASVVGGVNAALEMVQADELVKSFQVLKRSGATQSLARTVARELLARGIDVGTETAQEVAQEGATIAGAQLASRLENGAWQYDGQEVLDRLADTGISSALSFGMLNVPGAAHNIGHVVSDSRSDAKAGAQLRGYGDEVVRAVIDEGLESAPETASRRMAQSLRQKQEAGQAVSDAELGALYRENVRTVEQEWRTVSAPVRQDAGEADMGYARSAEDVARAPEQARRLAATLGENGSRAFLTVTEKEADPVTAFQGFAQVYNAARKGKPAPAGVELAPHIALAARESGRRDAHVAAQAAYFGEGAGLLRDASFRAAKVDRKTARTLDAVAKAAGVQVKFADRLVDEATGLEANARYEDRVITISRAASDPVKTVFTHEIAHRIREVDPQAWSTLSSYVLEHMEGEEMAQRYAALSSDYQTGDSDLIYEELVADAVGQLAGDGKVLEDFVKRHGGVARRVLDAVRDLLERVKHALGKGGAPLTAEERGAFQSLYRDVEGFSKALSSALEQTARTVEAGGQKNAAQAGGGAKYSLNADFGRQFDQWLAEKDGQDRLSTLNRFFVGTTSDALKSIGVSDYKIYWGASKIARIMEKHPGMTADVIKSVPEVLEHPVLVMQSQTVANRITLFGEAMDADGAPVLVAVELSPQKKTGEIRDFGVIASAYGKKNAQGIIDTSDILYVEPDKKRTDKWLLVLGLQLPSSITTYGSIHSVTQVGRDVNGNISFGDTGGKTAMELAFEKARGEKGDAVNQAEAGEGKASLKAASESREEFYRLWEVNAYLREQLRVSKVAKTDKKAVERLASTILDEYSSAYDRETLAGELRSLYDFMANGRDADGNELSWAPLHERAVETARRILEGARVLNDEAYQEYGALRDFLRTTKLTLAEADRADVPGGYADFTRRNRGRILTGKGGVAVDTAYRELAARWPEFFDEEITHPADQLARMEDVLDQLRPVYENPFAGDLEQAAEYLAGDIIERFYNTPQQAPTPADKAQRRLTEQKIHDDKKLEKLRIEKNARIAEIQAQGRERVRQVLQRERARRAEEVEAVKEHYRGREAEGRERRSARELRAKIQRHVSKLSRKLLRPSDKQHIPEALRGPVAALLEAINLESRYTIDQETGKRVKGGDGLPTKRTEAFRALKDAYGKIAREDSGVSLVIDPELTDNLSTLEEWKDTKLAEMGVGQLQTIWNTVRAIEKSISSANKLLAKSRYQSVAELAENIRISTASRRAKSSWHGPAGWADKLLNLDMMNPLTFFHQFGEGGDALYHELQAARDGRTRILAGTVDRVQQAVGKADIDALRKQTHTFHVEGGELTLTTAQLMSLYELSKREGAQDHIYKGGLRPSAIDAGPERGKGMADNVTAMLGKIQAPASGVKVTQGDVAAMLSALTEEQVKIADGLQAIMQGYLAEEGNRESMKVYGYQKFTEDHYFPISSDPHQIQDKIGDVLESGEKRPRSIAEWGSAKGTVEGANNGLLLGDIFDVFAQHAVDMATYASHLSTMEDLNRVRNFTFRDGEGNRTGAMGDIIQRVMGQGGGAYLNKLLQDVSAGTAKSNVTGLGKLTANYKAASVGFNIRVALQQPTSYLRAGAVIDPKYLADPRVLKKGGWAKALNYAPIAQWKDWGNFEINQGRQLQNIMFDTDGRMERLRSASMKLAGEMDSLTWGRLWNACELEVYEKRPGFQKGSEAFYEAVAERFTDIIDQTQVVDNVLGRSQIMRSGDALAKMATSYMGEPTQSYNLVYRAYRDWFAERNTAKRAAARKVLGRSIVALASSQFVNAIAQALWDAVRDDDDRDEKYWARVLGHILPNFVDNINPFNMVPYMKDVLSALQGYDVKRMDMEAITGFLSACRNLDKAIKGEGRYTLAGASVNLLAEVGRIFGISAPTVKRDLIAIARSVGVETGDWYFQYQLEKALNSVGYSGNRGEFYDIAFGALKDGEMDVYQDIAQDLMSQGVKASAIEKAMRERLESARKENPEFSLPQQARDIIGSLDKYQRPEEKKESDRFTAEDLNPNAYQQYARARAQDYREIADGLEDSPIFRDMDDEVKDAVLKAAYDLAEQSALEDASDGQYEVTTEWMTLTDDAERLGLEPWEYVLFHVAYNQAESTKGRDGKTVKGEAKSDHVREWLESDRSLTDRQREFLWGTVYQSEW